MDQVPLQSGGKRMTALWPELLVLVLFLAGDLFWDGMASAAAGAAAGVLSFVVLLFFKRRKPALILEGLVFGGITALGETVAFPGGNLIFMELVLGQILLFSALFRWNIFEKMAGGLGRGFISSAGQGILTAVMGGIFTLHSVIYAVLTYMGAGDLLAGVILFAVLYIVALKLYSSRLKEADRRGIPVLLKDREDGYVLKKQNENLGTFALKDNGGGNAIVSGVSIQVSTGEFLTALEKCLRREGFRFLLLHNWQEDELELEMDGFSRFREFWRKPL